MTRASSATYIAIAVFRELLEKINEIYFIYVKYFCRLSIIFPMN